MIKHLDDYGRISLIKTCEHIRNELQYIAREFEILERQLAHENFHLPIEDFKANEIDDVTWNVKQDYVNACLKMNKLLHSHDKLIKQLKNTYKKAFLQEHREDFNYNIIY